MPKKRRHKGGSGSSTLSTLEGTYEGDEEEGLRCGEGTLRWQNGDEYTGEFRDGMREGTGTFVFAGGTRRYEGGWSHSLRQRERASWRCWWRPWTPGASYFEARRATHLATRGAT